MALWAHLLQIHFSSPRSNTQALAASGSNAEHLWHGLVRYLSRYLCALLITRNWWAKYLANVPYTSHGRPGNQEQSQPSQRKYVLFALHQLTDQKGHHLSWKVSSVRVTVGKCRERGLHQRLSAWIELILLLLYYFFLLLPLLLFLALWYYLGATLGLELRGPCGTRN